jgi:Undecaprenyl-phosphate galactose phosphotransferase WbaP
MSFGLRRTILFTSDSIAVVFSAWITYALTLNTWENYSVDDLNIILVSQLVLSASALIYFSHKGHYTWRNPWWQQVRQTIRTCFIFVLISLLINLITLANVHEVFWVTAYWALICLTTLLFRWVARNLLKKLNHWDIPTVLIGGANNLNETIYALKSELYLSYNIKEVVLLDYTNEASEELQEHHPDINIVKEPNVIERHSMVILCPDEFSNSTGDIIAKIRLAGARFAVVPPTNGFSLYGLQTQFFFGHKIVLLETRNKLQTNLAKLVKSITDRVGAFFAILFLLPVFIILAIRIKKDGGPAFYNQVRVGKNGRPFKCWKFRTMVVGADQILQSYLDANPEAREEYEKDFKLKNDPRITSVGHFLRKSSLDEIPQFYNVLKGEMSLVGPRPIVEKEKHFYADKIDYYLSVKPGVTGLWQVSGRNDVSYDQRVKMDVWYTENWSFWNDIVICLKTIYVIFARKGAY